jgi:hybrid cluster-associated redox disulfide protein
MPEITKDTIIGQVLAIAPDLAPVFMAAGMHCLYCPSAQGETIEEACLVHGIDVDTLLDEIEAHLALKED